MRLYNINVSQNDMSMRTKKRPQYIQELVKETNKRLEVMNIKDEGDTLFRFVCDLLLKKKMYQGYNFFQKKTILIDGKAHNVLDYPTQEEFKADKWDCLQIY